MEITDKDIEKLGDLARIKLSEEEKKGLKTDIESILGYVSEIQEVSSDLKRDTTSDKSEHINIMREDGEPHESGLYTEKILENAPQREGDYIKVKKIL
ncbi:Asp-tRNA(Asn)/Glu-tRNA(Gln) amidotransferase subunit GatC [bacterium]|jgi:aspartyl-tRNA(Asn)/glutamyl-tRNA(Gln) amidotransferase subunit C|nr:Asp-tRNA(Asn)/Glu-tRNA(Gln) amidotransferase subunit GatC [bacterium]MBT3729913.1 Asp-tRNA(Asn)/Glu-tRNA(Gln) amidotransferase subunit GatC [bacterium]MBT4894879.1 Asp-tRNA(Asn)/Glu-tRNA(Gln) amidotransferase subunit GatC [bacterium]